MDDEGLCSTCEMDKPHQGMQAGMLLKNIIIIIEVAVEMKKVARRLSYFSIKVAVTQKCR